MRRANAIYGPATYILKGKMVIKKPEYIALKQRSPIHVEIINHHPELPLNMDFFHQ